MSAPNTPNDPHARNARRRRDDRPPPPSERSSSPPSPKLRLFAVGALAVISLVVLAVLFSGSSESTKPPPAFVTDTTAAPQVQRVDGTLTEVSEQRLVLRPFSGEAEMEFVILPEDLPNFDIAHMLSHSSVALPTRIYYERDGDQLVAKYKEDAPANSRREQE